MAPKIEKLTPEQEAMIPAFRQQWLEVGLSTEPVDRQASTEAVQNLYRAAGWGEPNVLHFDSPAQCVLAIHSLRESGLEDQFEDQIEDSFTYQLDDQFSCQLEYELRRKLNDQLGKPLRQQLRGQLWDHIERQLKDQFENQLLKTRLRQLWAQPLSGTNFRGGQDSYWLALYDFGQRIGFEYKWRAHLEAYKHYARTSGCGYFYSDIAFVSGRPTSIMRLPDGRLHNDKGPAISFADGFEIWALNGRRMRKESS